MPQAGSPTKPAGWAAEHDIFVRRHAKNGEDASSITILLETEYPRVAVTNAWIKRKVEEMR